MAGHRRVSDADPVHIAPQQGNTRLAALGRKTNFKRAQPRVPAMRRRRETVMQSTYGSNPKGPLP